jgi:hypothetical protein
LENQFEDMFGTFLFKENVITVKYLPDTITKNIEDFRIDFLIKALKFGYSNPKKEIVVWSTLLNAILTSHNQTFLMSRKYLNKIISKDPNNFYKSINGNFYKDFLGNLLESGDLEKLREPTSNKAGVYKIKNKSIVDNLYLMHNKEWFEKQEGVICEAYDGYKILDGDYENGSDLVRKRLKNKGWDV